MQPRQRGPSAKRGTVASGTSSRTGSNKRPVSGGKRGASGGLRRSGSAGKRRQSTMPGSSRSAEKKPPPIKAKLQRMRMNGLELLDRGDTREGLKELNRSLQQRVMNAAKLGKFAEPLWEYAEEVTLIANNEAVFRDAAAEPSEEVQIFFKEAMRYISVKEDEVGARSSPGSSSARRRQSSSIATPAWKKADYFADFPALKGMLRSVVLNNLAVHQRSISQVSAPTSSSAAYPDQAATLASLMNALKHSSGNMCTGILYNMAVIFTGAGRFDDAVEAIARCVELGSLYLKCKAPPLPGTTHNNNNNNNNTNTNTPTSPQAPSGAASASSAAAASPAAATAEEAAAAAAEVRAWLAYNTLISMVASHLVMAHHLVATIAEWCGLPEEELYHCKLALGCAQKYLPKHHPMHKRCANRLAAPQHRPAPAEASEVVPPQLQLLAQGELVAAPCALFELSELTPFANAAAAAGRLPALPLSALLAICSTVTLPRDLRAYLRSVDGILAKEQQRGGGGGVSLPPIISAGGRRSTVSLAGGDKRRSIMTEEGSSLRTGSGQATSGSTWREGTPAQHGQDNNNNNNNNKDDDGADHRSCVVTKIPRPAFERYQQLNKETVGYLKMSNASTNNNNNNMNDGLAPDASGSIFSGTGRLPPLHSAGTSPRPFMNDRRRSSLYVAPAEATNSSTTNPHMMSGGTTDNNNNASPIITAADGHTASPSHFMRGMDRDLLRFSKVQRDKIREIQEPAAIKIQRMWRCHLMRKIVRAKQAAVQEWLDKMDAAMMLYHAYLLWKERQPAVAELQRLKDERERQRKITLIQRYLREKQSVEEWGRKCAELHERLLLAKLQREKEIAAATMIQTCWRRHDAQQQLKKAIYAATRIENAWRCRQARRELMIRRVHQRLRYEAFLRSAMPQIIYIQTWWRACMARRAVADELPRRKKAIEDYLRAMEDFFNTQLGHLSEVPNVERCIQKVMGVLRGARDRAEMRATHAKWLIVRRLIFQRVLMHRGAHELEALREKHAIERAIQRRREEVLLACERLQSAARMWAAKKEARRRRALVAHRHHAALVVQRAFRRFKDRSFLAALRAKQGMAEEIAKMGQVRQYCATKIQATWRMHRVRTANASYLRFMAMDRHAYATRAQQAWRAYRARREAAQRGAVVREYRKDRQQHERRAVAAVKMQSVARMYLCRRRLQDEDGITLAESPFKLFFAARAIQTAWRAMAARRYVHQAMLARAYFHHERCATEALNAYAIIIQRAVRQHLLAAPSSASSSSPKNAVVEEEEEEQIDDVRGLPVDELEPSLAPLCDCLESVAAELPGISLRYHEEVLQQSANDDDDAQQPCVRYSWTVMMVDDAEGEVLGEANGKHEDRVEALCVALTIAAEVLLTIRVDESEGGTASRQDGLTEEGSNMNRDDEDDATAMADNEEEQQQEEEEEEEGEEEEVPVDDDVDAMPPSNMKQSPSEQLQADALYYNSERDSSHAEPTSRQSFGGTQQQQQQQQDDAMVADDSRQLNSADGTTESERLREMAAYYNSDDEASRRESLRQTQLNGTTDSAQLREAATFYRSEYESEGQTPSMRTTIHADFDGTTDSQGLRNAAAYYNEEYRPESQGS